VYDIERRNQPHDRASHRAGVCRAGNLQVERLMEFLTALGREVRIAVQPTRKRVGEMEFRRAR
jgi:hypothetical protein